MTKSIYPFLLLLYLILTSCSENSTKVEPFLADLKTSSLKSSSRKIPKEGLHELLEIKHQVEIGNYKQIEDFISQISKDTLKMTPEERLSFPQPNKAVLVDFLKSINRDSLETNLMFEKKYSFHSAPKEYKADSEECPDGLTINFDEKTNEFTLQVENRFLINQDVGCAESITIYYFTTVRSKFSLKRLNYAG